MDEIAEHMADLGIQYLSRRATAWNLNIIPVLLEETIEHLNIRPDGIYVDGTLGGAGHCQ